MTVEQAREMEGLTEQPLSSVPLALKLARIMGAIGDLQPDGSNNHFSYKYFTDKQLSGTFRQRFANMGIILVPEVLEENIIQGTTSRGGTTYLTNLKVRFTFYDGYTGETISGIGFGQGDDPGDKGANKAMTGAMKYFLMKTFQVGGEADAEADDATDQRATAPASKPQVKEQRPAQVKPSTSGGEVKRGGRQASATEAQVMQIRLLAKELKIDAKGIGAVVSKVIDAPVELAAGEEGKQLIELLGSLSSKDLGEVVSRLETAKQRSEQLDKDFEQAEAILTGAEAPSGVE